VACGFVSSVKLGKKPSSGNSAQRDKLHPGEIRAGWSIGMACSRPQLPDLAGRSWRVNSGKELMRHSCIPMTMDTYEPGVESANRIANANVVAMLNCTVTAAAGN